MQGFTVRNPDGTNAIVSNDNSNININNNRVMDVGNSLLSGQPVHAILIEASAEAIDNIDILNNMVMALDGGEGGSVSAITIGFSTGNHDVTDLVVDANMITDVDASILPFASYPSGGRGAYGILINLGSGAGTGEVVSPVVTKNNITDLEGLWAHAIGLEGPTPNADVSENVIDDVVDHKVDVDAVGIMVEQNSGAASVLLRNNNLTNVDLGVRNVTGIEVDARLNWWGAIDGPGSIGSGSGVGVTADVLYCPWLEAAYPMVGPAPANNANVRNNDTGGLFCSIQDAISHPTTDAGDVIEVIVTEHTEPGQVIVDKNLTIQGQGKLVTTVKSGFSSASGGHDNPLSAWIRTLPGTDVTIQDMTLDGNGMDTYTAVRFTDDGLVDDVAFNDIKHSASPYLGIAVQVQDGEVDITNSMFTNIGRIGAHYRNGVIPGASISGTFANNMYTGKGDGDWLDYAMDISGGVTIEVLDNVVSGNTGMADSDGSTSAGFLVTTYFPFEENIPNDVEFEGNDISGNTTGIAVGFDANDVSVVVANNNNITGNGTGVSSTGPQVNAALNWWGDAGGPSGEGPGTIGDPVGTDVGYCPWLTGPYMGVPVPSEGLVLNTTTMISYCTIQGAIDDGNTLDGHTLELSPATYFERVVVDKELTLIGVGTNPEDHVIDGADISGPPYYGISIERSNVTLQNLQVQDVTNSDYFGIHSDCGTNNLTIEDVIVDGCGLTGIALNGGDGIDLINITSTNNVGNGVSLTDCQNVTINGITTSGNAFAGGFNAGIGLFSGTFCTFNGIDGFELTGSVSIGEDVKVYSQLQDASHTLANITGSTIEWAVGTDALNRSYWPDKLTSYAVVEALYGAPYNLPPSTLYVAEVATDNFYVEDEPNGNPQAMSIQAAETFLSAGKTIYLEEGTYDEQVVIDQALTLTGVGPAKPVIDFTGAVVGKATVIDVTAANVTIDGIQFDVDMSVLSSAVIASGATSGLTIINNMINPRRSGGYAEGYGQRNAISINYAGYRVNGSNPLVTVSDNMISYNDNSTPGDPGDDAGFRSGVSMDEGAGLFEGNDITSINHDILSRFNGAGALTIQNNNIFRGGGVQVASHNAGAGAILIDGNQFDSPFAYTYTSALRLQYNNQMKTTTVSNNTFNGHSWGISLENYNTVTIDNNTFTPNALAPNYRHITVNTKVIVSDPIPISQTEINAVITNNDFDDNGNPGEGTGIAFYNHDDTAPTFGTFTVGTVGNANDFQAGIGNFMLYGDQTGDSDDILAQFPEYGGSIGVTPVDCWPVNIDIENNNFDVGSGLQLPSAMTATDLAMLEDFLYHHPDNNCLGYLLYTFPVHNITQNTFHLTIQDGVDNADPGDELECATWLFTERVNIDKSVTIRGQGATTVLDGTSQVGNGDGIFIQTGVEDVTIEDMTIQNFAGANGNTDAGIYANGQNDGLTVQDVFILNNVGGSGIYANGPVDNVLIDNCEVGGHSSAARGIVIWNGFKTNITITDNEVYGSNCCGIELQDGTASGVTITGNYVHDNADNGLGLMALTSGAGPNLIQNNIVEDNGRFGIEIKNPDGTGVPAGDGSIVVDNNTVTFTPGAGMNDRDHAGIAVHRRAFLVGEGYNDIPTGVIVTNNEVTGYEQQNPGSTTSEGFGIVIEGVMHTVEDNELNNNEVAIQLQGGGHANANYTANMSGDGGQEDGDSPDYFGRGNAPYVCDITLGTNTFSGSITADVRMVTANVNTTNATVIADLLQGQVHNVTQNTYHCTIQDAIDAPTTVSNDVIDVPAGTYYENVVVDKEVEIRGPNYGISPNTGSRVTEAIVHPAVSQSDAIFLVEADNVIIDGLTLDGDNPIVNTGWTGTNGADLDAFDGIGAYDPNNVISVSGLEVRNNIITNLVYFGVDNFGWYNYNNPPTSGHLVDDNLFTDLGTYGTGSGYDFWGGGVLIYNDNYTRITNNTMTNVRIGVQTGNFHAANPGDPMFQVIDNNTIETRRRGIFYNLHTGPNVEPLTVSNNDITAIAEANEVTWDGILMSSLSDAVGLVQNNTIDGSAAIHPSQGFEVWNVNPNAPVHIDGGSASNVDIGVFVNNFEGYNSDGGNTAGLIDGVDLTVGIDTGVYVKDSPLNTNGATVAAEVTGDTDVETNTTDGVGIYVSGADASVNLHTTTCPPSLATTWGSL